MAGEARPSPVYYVALAVLAVGVLAGLSLFLVLATRPHSTAASIEWSDPLPIVCAVGGHGTVCYQFTLTNTGNGPAFASCTVSPASGTQATFDNNQTMKPVNLLEGQSRDLIVSVVADQSSTLSKPSVSCSASSV